MDSTVTGLDLDELARQQGRLIADIKTRLDRSSVIMRLREISKNGILSLDAHDLDSIRTELTLSQRRQIVDRAAMLLSSFYVHLAAKRALYASDPLQALRNLRGELGPNSPDMSEEQFHDRMTAIFVGLRDRHTNYYLPAPYRDTIVFLPFLIEPTMDTVSGTTKYFVTKLASASVADDDFPVPTPDTAVEVTHINAVPIEHVVARNGDESAGSNRAARHARGVDRLTFRWLGLGTGPRETWVDLRYTLGGQSHERRFEWLAARKALPVNDAGRAGRDPEGVWIGDVKDKLFHKSDIGPPPAARDSATTWTPIEDRTAMYRTFAGADGTEYGLLRIFNFEVRAGRVDAYIRRIANILRRAPEAGLVIDVRGNPGGNVNAAEGLLQLFSGRRVARQGIQFLNEPDAVTLASVVFKSVMDQPVSDARDTAAPFVLLGEMPHDDLTPGEQAYQGPVVLIVDANCYSASEMFAAGMQDNRLACVIGTHKQTGGGGAVLWSDERIAKDCADRDLRGRLGPLPGGASFDIAVLRTTRAGDRAGVAVEDMGVIAEQVHELTRRDVLGGNEDLLAVAAEKLAAPNDRPLVHAAYRRGAFRLRTRNVERVEIYLDDALVQTISELTQDHKLPAPVSPPRGRVVFRGVAQGEVVTTYRAGRPATAPRPPGIQPGPYE